MKLLRKMTIPSLVVSALLLGAGQAQAAIQFDMSSLPGAGIDFQNGSFRFTPGSQVDQFEIDNSSSLAFFGRSGYFTGTFAIGTITTISSSIQFAPVTGSGQLVIHDGFGKELTATLVWDTISRIGTVEAMNTDGVANLSNFAYNGTVPDFQALANAASGIQTLSFQFTTPVSLQNLKLGKVDAASFSSSVSAVPEPTTVIAGALLLLPFAASTLRMLRKQA